MSECLRKWKVNCLDCFCDQYYYRNKTELFMFSIHIHFPKYWFDLKICIPKRGGLFLRTHRVVTKKKNQRWLLSLPRGMFWEDCNVFWLGEQGSSHSMSPSSLSRGAWPLCHASSSFSYHRALLPSHFRLYHSTRTSNPPSSTPPPLLPPPPLSL